MVESEASGLTEKEMLDAVKFGHESFSPVIKGIEKLVKKCSKEPWDIEKKDHSIVDYLLSKMGNYIDVVVPRGGKNLVSKVKKISKINIIGHLEGLCHLYVDKDADLTMAKKLVINAKMRRTSICGALETLLINNQIISSHGIDIIKSLLKSGCQVRVCLLYTSPSPRDLSTSRMPSSA